MTDATFAGGEVDLREWFLPHIDSIDPDKTLREILLDVTAEALQAAVENSEAHASFKFDYENPVVTSPGILQFTIPLGQEFEGPAWTVDLSQVVNDFVAARLTLNGLIPAGDDATQVGMLRDYLQGLVTQIDTKLEVSR